MESICGIFRIPFLCEEERKACGLAVMRVSDFSEFLSAKWLSKPEEKKFNSISSEKIKIQFACGRVAAKAALGIFEDIAPSNVEIANEANGRPIICNSAYGVSISHSGEWIACLVFPKEFLFGIDVEQMRSNRRNALKYMSGEELIPDNLQNLTVAWTLKEALSKALKLGFYVPFEELAISHFSGKNGVFECEFTKRQTFKGLAIFCGNTSLAIVCEKKCLWDRCVHQTLFSACPAA
ncbi:MAG: 4'-phosphopantetheinyl transferase superfamily protein [Holosporaceae bacterium]|jgi:phosphopantetheinyl transferase|nr:4'-phosphopantetheinyl transferase superfamily protein [Holosporaceae bacterium]